jgi:hypothetical protein
VFLIVPESGPLLPAYRIMAVQPARSAPASLPRALAASGRVSELLD